MPRSPLRISVEDGDRLAEFLDELTTALAHKEQCHDSLQDWQYTIQRINWIIRDARADAEDRDSGARPVRPRDTQKSKVYRAEATRVAPDNARFFGAAQQARYLALVVEQPWFQNQFPGLTMDKIVVGNNRSASTSVHHYVAYAAKPHRIAFKAVVNKLTVLHELAHACHRHLYGGGHAAHAPEFLGILVHLVVREMGQTEGEALARAYKLAGCQMVGILAQINRLAQAKARAARAAQTDPIMSIVQRSAR